MNRKQFIVYFFIVIIPSFLLLNTCRQKKEEPVPEAPRVRVQPVQATLSYPLLSVSGSLEAVSTVHLAFQVAGRLR